MLSYWPFVGWKNIGFKSVHQCAPCITYVYFWWFLLLYYDNLKQKDRNLQISIPISVHLYALKSIFTSNSFQDIDWKVRKCKNINLGFVTHPDHCAMVSRKSLINPFILLNGNKQWINNRSLYNFYIFRVFFMVWVRSSALFPCNTEVRMIRALLYFWPG